MQMSQESLCRPSFEGAISTLGPKWHRAFYPREAQSRLNLKISLVSSLLQDRIPFLFLMDNMSFFVLLRQNAVGALLSK
jgi:hypothetical protein